MGLFYTKKSKVELQKILVQNLLDQVLGNVHDLNVGEEIWVVKEFGRKFKEVKMAEVNSLEASAERAKIEATNIKENLDVLHSI